VHFVAAVARLDSLGRMHGVRFIAVLTGLGALLVCGCAQRLPSPRTSGKERSFPLTKTQPDPSLAFSFAASKPFHLEFGRGSGRDGLDTITFDETGRTVLHRSQFEYRYHLRYGKMISPFWERAEVKLSEESVQRLSKAILELSLPQMARAYHAGVFDGTQWIFWLRQGGREKSIYFNNHFPAAIQAFADLLDAELNRAGVENARWQRVPRAQERSHDRAIWKSIEGGT
jgi:hypothetical protein